MVTPPSERTKVFICYSASKRDKDHFECLKKHLRPLERNGKIDVWDRTQIKVGHFEIEETKQAINLTCVAVILLSSDLLASDFIDKHELTPLFAAAENKKITLLPVLLSACNWESTYLEKLIFVNRDRIPAKSLPDDQREELWKKTADNVSSALQAASSLAASTSSKAQPDVLSARYQEILDRLMDKELEPQKRVTIAYSLIEPSETLTRGEQALIQDNLHSIRIDEPDTQMYNAITLVLAFLNDKTAYLPFQSLFLKDTIPPVFRERAAKYIAQKIEGTKLISLLTGQAGTHYALEAGLDIVRALQYTDRADLKRLLRALLDQHPFTATVRVAILNALEPTRG